MTATIKLNPPTASGPRSGPVVRTGGGHRSGGGGSERRRPVNWLADFGVAALRVHDDPPGFPAVQFLVASLGGQHPGEGPGEDERQRLPGQHEDPEDPRDGVERDVQVEGDLVVGGRGPQQAVERDP